MDQTLEELDGERWGEADSAATGLIRECHRLRKVPVESLTNDELRLLLGQRIGTAWLVPVALTRLGQDPLAGDLYPGDLLNAVLRTDAKYWETHPRDVARLLAVRGALEKFGADASKFLARDDWPPAG